MAEKVVLQPSAEHPITLAPHPGHVTVRVGGRTIADTTHALALSEASYPPVLYIPLADVEEDQLIRTDHYSYCPYKGDASYYSIRDAGESGENAVWEYRDPYPSVAEIKDTVAFYADRVEITAES